MKRIERLKIMTILGTRPEIIRLSRILPTFDEFFDHVVVYTQQSYDYELSTIFFKELELRKPDYILSVKSETIGGQISNILKQTEEVMLKEKPDGLLVLGDTNSSLSALIAKRLKILIFHMEAGNRCFNWDVPEEVNRAVIDVLSDYNLPYTQRSFEFLVAGGIHPSKMFITGSPLREVYKYYHQRIEASPILKKIKLKKQKYFVVSTHREENVDRPDRLKELFSSFNHLAERYGYPIIVTLHPRTKSKLSVVKDIHPLIQLHKPFGILDYIKLEKNSLCVLSDSGTIAEESALLGFHAVQIRSNIERTESIDKGIIVLTGLNKNAIINAIQLVVKGGRVENSSIPDDYKDINVSLKITKLVMGLASVRKYT